MDWMGHALLGVPRFLLQTKMSVVWPIFVSLP